jgi:hypothetical protein
MPFNNNGIVQPLPNIGLDSCDAQLLSGIKVSMTYEAMDKLSTTTLNAIEVSKHCNSATRQYR